jgi:hypothetical protein
MGGHDIAFIYPLIPCKAVVFHQAGPPKEAILE